MAQKQQWNGLLVPPPYSHVIHSHIHTHTLTNNQTYAEKSITSADKNWRRVPSIHYKMSWVYVWCEPHSVSGAVVASSMLSIFVSFRFCDANAGEALRRVWGRWAGEGLIWRQGGVEVAATPIIRQKWRKGDNKMVMNGEMKEICQPRRIPIRL